MMEKIAVIGAGTMGHSIALSFALHGYSVHLYDAVEDQLPWARGMMEQHLKDLAEGGLVDPSKADETLGRIRFFHDLKGAVEDREYIIEAAPENIGLKRELFAELDRLAPSHAVLASNTSSLALDDMMRDISEERKKRTMINHWFHPAHLIPLVEMSCFGNMPEPIYMEVENLYRSIGKQTVKVLKPLPGLIANRIQQGVAREVFSLLQQGAAAPEDIDKALQFGPAFRYATAGQLAVADMGGLDIWCIVGDNLLKEMDNSTCANPLLREKVAEGKLGIKTGAGFYEYDPSELEQVRREFNRRLIHQLKASMFYMKR
jgi:3-hydroxybutyryl-CoA dehydrogenase